MSNNTSPRALLTSFFILLTLFSCALCAPLSTVMRRDVWVPTITSPTSAAYGLSEEPSEVTNPTGQVYLRQGDATQSNPIASGFPLTDGQVEVTIPEGTTAGTYMIVLFGDSGNWSPEFQIEAAT
ncbi:hypothetical protein BD769DRAFT_1382114 [Suillus cothurnatus]|nr:hypothetical protein BD769DRAFT_1382114 [Suillus cothurnatus]